MYRGRALTLALLVAMLVGAASLGRSATPAESIVSGTITLVNSKTKDPSYVAVWLEPTSGQAPMRKDEKHLVIRQKNKVFVPHVIIATVGQQVDFPNDDPFPHNIFSNSEVKRFDLGLYQAGESRTVPLTRAGVIPVYCNIHPQMKAFIVVVKTPYYALSDNKGEFQIRNVPPGNYNLTVWHERAKQETLDALSRQVKVTATGANLGTIQIDESGIFAVPHKNKDGRDYN